MSLLPRGLALVVFSAGALVVPSHRPMPVSPAGSGSPVSRGVRYTPLEKEFYLAADQVDYIRPGLKVAIVSVTNVAPGKKPVVEITMTDSLNQPVDRLGAVTPGPVAPAFVLASWDAGKRQYFAYTTRTTNGAVNPATDQNGTWTDLELGRSRYTFGTALPADFDVTKMLTLGVQARRVMPAEVLDGKTYYADNVFKDFRGDGGATTPVWNAINTDTACNNCHNPLALHGGQRRSVRLCVLCHQPQHTLSETGESFDLKVMIHRIHRGENLPSVKAGKPFVLTGTNDYSTVAFPQDIRNCYYCHEGTDPAKKPVGGANWYTYPSSKACGSCHDDVNFTTGVGHKAGPQTDATCADCHLPQGDAEWDASVIGAHTVPDKSKQLKGLKAEIISVDQAAPGKKPVVTFKLTNGDGTILDPKTFGSNLNIDLGGPTSDYTLFPDFRERADGATFNGTVGTYTFTNAIPADASGTWTFAIECRRIVTLNPAPVAGPATYQEGAFNPIKYVAITGGTPKPRRTLVSLDKCNKCHNRLASLFSHGGQRISLELCVICHNPNHKDRNPDGTPESGAFKRMIHRIHTGEELTQDYTIWGGSPTNFNGVRFPGDRRDCLACHVNAAAYSLPVSTDAIPVVTPRDLLLAAGSRHGRVPRLSRQPRRGRPRVPEHGELPRSLGADGSLRHVPRDGGGLGRRESPRAVGRERPPGRDIAHDLLLSGQMDRQAEESRWFWATLILSSVSIVAVVLAAWELVENRYFREADYVTLHYLYISRGVASSFILASWAAWYVLRERRRSEEELRRSREHYRHLLEASPGAVALYDASLRVTEWNATAERLYGFTKAEVLGQPIPVVLPERSDELRELLRNAEAGEPVLDFETVRRDNKGVTFEVQLSLIPFREAPGKTDFLEVTTDIRERVRLRQTLLEIEKLTSMGKMAAGTAHHLNTPLAAMLLRVQMMRERSGQGPGSPDLEKLESALLFCQQFVRRLLEFGRNPAAQKQPEEIAHSIESVVSFLAPALQTKRARVPLDLSGADGAQVLADRNLLEALFLILLSNALDAISNEGTIAVRCRRTSPDRVEIEIADDGCGIAPADHPHLFEPFFTTKGPGRGTGLGLAIARNIVLEHRGSIHLENAPVQGTVALVELPVWRPAPASEGTRP